MCVNIFTFSKSQSNYMEKVTKNYENFIYAEFINGAEFSEQMNLYIYYILILNFCVKISNASSLFNNTACLSKLVANTHHILTVTINLVMKEELRNFPEMKPVMLPGREFL